MTTGRRRTRSGIAALVLGAGLTACGVEPPKGVMALVTPGRASTLKKIAAEEQAAGTIERRRTMIADLNQQLLMKPPDDVLVPELFDLLIAMTPHMETGELSPSWSAYVYTSYQRDLLHERPTGTPRRTEPEIEAKVKDYVDYYSVHFRPGGMYDPSAAALSAEQEWRTERRLGR